jgi:hypothetical protein
MMTILNEISCNLLNLLLMSHYLINDVLNNVEYVFIVENVKFFLFHMKIDQNFKSYTNMFITLWFNIFNCKQPYFVDHLQ